MNYKDEPSLIKFSSIYDDDENDDKIFNREMVKIPLDIDYYTNKAKFYIENGDLASFKYVMNDFTKELRNKQSILPNDYPTHKASSFFFNLFNPVERPQLLSTLLPFFLAWTYFQNDNDYFSNEGFLNYIIEMIQCRVIDENYEDLENYQIYFYHLLNNILIDSQKLRYIFIYMNPVKVFSEIYLNRQYYENFEMNDIKIDIINKVILRIFTNLLVDFDFSYQLPETFSLANFYEKFVHRIGYLFDDTKRYEFDFLYAFIRSSGTHLRKFLSHFEIQTFFEEFEQLSDEGASNGKSAENVRIFPFLRIVRKILKNRQNIDEGVFNTMILPKIKCDSMINCFREHDDEYGRLEYLKFVRTLFSVDHDQILYFLNDFPDEFHSFISWVAKGKWLMRKEAFSIFRTIFSIKSEVYFRKVFEINNEILLEFIDLIEYGNNDLTANALEIFVLILSYLLEHQSNDLNNTFVEDIFNYFTSDILESIDEMRYTENQSSNIVNLCTSIIENSNKIRSKIEEIEERRNKYKESQSQNELLNLFDDYSDFGEYDDFY